MFGGGGDRQLSVEQSKASRADYDVIVIGGGPAGSTAATLVAQAGRSVLLLDRESFPRFRIGESLMPATYWTLKRLGVLEQMKASPFVRKHSVQFFSKSGRSSVPFYFSEVDDHESSATWQVDRLSFDVMLLDNARNAGVEVIQRANVKDVLFDGSRARGVRVEFGDGHRTEIVSNVVVDASGQTGLLSRKLELKNPDPKLWHASIYTRYSGARRDEGIDEGATLIMHTEEGRSWFWYIPLQDDQVSVGVVAPMDYLLKGRSGGPQGIFDEELRRCPAMQQRVEGAEQIMDATAVRDFSYISKRIAGDGWVLAGDAFGFLDPIYSTGVFLALESGRHAADSIIEAFEKQDFSAGQLGRHGDAYVAGMEALRKLVYVYYDEEFNFAHFLKRFPHRREDLVNLLIGNVFRKPVDEMFEEMSRICRLPEARRLEPPEPSG
jgi:flavin-dependent dehydrogenase